MNFILLCFTLLGRAFATSLSRPTMKWTVQNVLDLNSKLEPVTSVMPCGASGQHGVLASTFLCVSHTSQKYEPLCQCWFNVEPASQTVDHMSSICHLCVICMTPVCHPCVIRMTSICHTCTSYDIRRSSACHPYDICVSFVGHPCAILMTYACHPCVIRSLCHPCFIRMSSVAVNHRIFHAHYINIRII